MSLVVVNVSAGSAVVTLPSISSVPGRILTVKDNGSASATNIATLTPSAGDTFESGVATYLLNTPFAYVTFIGNGATLKWRVLDSTYPDIPINIPPIIPSPGTLGGVTGTLTNLTVSGPTLLGNSSNTGNLGVAGTATISTLSVTGNAAFSKLQVQGGLSVFSSIAATNLNFTGGLYSNGVLFTGGSGSPTFSTISTIGQAAFNSNVEVRGSLSVFSSMSAYNMNVNGPATFASTITNTSGFAQILPDQLLIDNSRGFCFDPSGNIYVNASDRGMIYKINPQGVFSLFAGTYTYGLDINVDGIGTNAMFTLISNMCYDSYTGCIILGGFGTVRLLNPVTAQVTTIAGNYSASGTIIPGNAVGTGKAAQFQWAFGVCTDNAGNFYVADNTYNNIKKVSISSPTPAANSGVVTMVAGSTSTTAADTKGYTNATGTQLALTILKELQLILQRQHYM
jgi:hypothetical protein